PTVNGNYGLPTSGGVNFIVDTNVTTRNQTSGGTFPAPSLTLGDGRTVIAPLTATTGASSVTWGRSQTGALPGPYDPFAQTLPGVSRIKLMTAVSQDGLRTSNVTLNGPIYSGNAIWEINSQTPQTSYDPITKALATVNATGTVTLANN